MRANYAHRYEQSPEAEPAAVTPEQPTYAVWGDVPRGALLVDAENDPIHKRSDGTWCWWWDWTGKDDVYEMGTVYPPDDLDGVSSSDCTQPWTLLAMVSDDITGERVAALVRGKTRK